MLEYQLDSKIRRRMRRAEPVVKAALCVIANERFGYTETPQGIFKYEGGIVVNGREIAIGERAVRDDWDRPKNPTPEEKAVVDAIVEVAKIIETEGLAVLTKRYGNCRIGAPLRRLVMMA